jgi:hypothetical protein
MFPFLAVSQKLESSECLGAALKEYLAGKVDGYLFQTSEGKPWDTSNVLGRTLNGLLEHLEIPKIDPRLLAKFVGKDTEPSTKLR